MEGVESTPYYHRNFIPSNHNHNPNSNDNKPNPCTNAVYRVGCERTMVSLEQPISISNNNTNTHNDTASSPSPLYSECKNPSPMFSPAVSERRGIGIGMVGPDSFKRKRGRPRKYGTTADGFVPMGIPLSPVSPDKKGSGKKAQMAALGSPGQGFTAHVITIATGEDVCKKIMAFMQHGPWAVCVLSANGAISNATLRQPSVSGGIVTYEGRFEILSLSGSFLLTEVGGARTRTGGLSVSLAGSDGRVVGGGVGGLLTAATPVQVVVGTFLFDSKDLVCIGNDEPSMGTSSACMPGVSPSASTAVMQPRVEACGGSNLVKSCHEQNAGSGSYNLQSQVLNMTPLQSIDWASPALKLKQRVTEMYCWQEEENPWTRLMGLNLSKEMKNEDQNLIYENYHFLRKYFKCRII